MINLTKAVVAFFVCLQPFCWVNAESDAKAQLDERISGDWYSIHPRMSYLETKEDEDIALAKCRDVEDDTRYVVITEGRPGSFQHYYEGGCNYSNVRIGNGHQKNHFFADLECAEEGTEFSDSGSFLFQEFKGGQTYLVYFMGEEQGGYTYLKCPQ